MLKQTPSAQMKYSKNLFQFSNGTRTINYSRFIRAANGTKILLPASATPPFPLVPHRIPELVLGSRFMSQAMRGQFQYFYILSMCVPLVLVLLAGLFGPKLAFSGLKLDKKGGRSISFWPPTRHFI
jgi:hypothetical protein